MTTKALTTAERVAKMRTLAAGKGHLRREYYATLDEHGQLKQKLKDIRK